MFTSLDSIVRKMFWSLSARMWDEQATTQPFVQPILEIIQSHLPQTNDQLIDVGCGAGVFSVALAEAGYDVIGVDAAAGMIARAKMKLTAENAAHLHFEAGDLDGRLPYQDASFDAAIAISVLQSVQNPARASKEILRILKPGAIFVVLHFLRPAHHDRPIWQQIKHRTQMLRRKTPRNVIMASAKTVVERSNSVKYWSVQELQALLTAQGFCIESIVNTNPIIIVAKRPFADLHRTT